MLKKLEIERKATWLELFYDLIYVAAMGKIADLLSENFPGDTGNIYLLRYFLTFLPFWWCWLGHTIIQNQIITEGFGQKLFTFGKMFLIIVMISMVNENQKHFVILYSLIRLTLIVNYHFVNRGKVGFQIQAKKLIQIYTLGLLISFASIFFSGNLSNFIFYLGIFVEIILVIFRKNVFDDSPLHREHLVERLGLFTIILMGESVIEIAMNLTLKHQIRNWENAFIDFILLCSIWGIYYESTIKNIIRYEAKNEKILMLGHLPLHLGLGIISVVLGAAVEREMEWDKFIFLVMVGFFLFYMSKQFLRNVDSFSWSFMFLNLFKGSFFIFVPLWLYLKNASNYQEVILLLSAAMLGSLTFILYRENMRKKI